MGHVEMLGVELDRLAELSKAVERSTQAAIRLPRRCAANTTGILSGPDSRESSVFSRGPHVVFVRSPVVMVALARHRTANICEGV